MPSYKAPVEDFLFVFHDLLRIEERTDLPGFADLTPDMTGAMLEGGAKFFEEVLQPVNQSGDEEGCVLENGVVRTPKGFKEAFGKFCEAGWNRLGAPEAAGGANLPFVVGLAFTEMASSANQALYMYGGLSAAAAQAIWQTGEAWMREHVVPRMVSGEWTGTMCLTEPHCGTDLKLMKTKAVLQPDGSYRITGTKIFISGGDHDMTDNIMHTVIAKIPDDEGKLHDDLATVNFFLVPKFLVDPETGSVTHRNGVTTGGVEKKMGIKGNATCVLNFDDAVAYRLQGGQSSANGAKPSRSAGMAGMFSMMNFARMGVGTQGIAIGEVAYQNGRTYARERLAGRALTGTKNPDGPADPIIVYPDVRRLLMSSRAFVEGARDEGARRHQQPPDIRVDDDRIGGPVGVLGAGERPAGEPFPGIGAAVLIGDLADRDALRADAHAGEIHHRKHAGHSGRARRLGPVRAALAALQTIGHGVVEIQHTGRIAFDPHLLLDAAGGDAVAMGHAPSLGIDQEFRHQEEIYRRQIVVQLAFVVRDLGDHRVHDVVGHVVIAAGNEDLRSGDPIAAVGLEYRLGLHQLEVGAAMRLGQAHGAGPFARHHARDDMLAHPGLAGLPDRLSRRRGQSSVHIEGLIGRRRHLGEGQAHHERQIGAARRLRRAQPVPSRFAELPERFLEALGCPHDTVFQHASFFITALIYRLEHFLEEFSTPFEHGSGHVRCQVGKARQIGALFDPEQIVEHEQEIFHGCLIAWHWNPRRAQLTILSIV